MLATLAPGACVGHPDPDLWHDDDRVAQAQAICRTCPVVTECLNFSTDPRTVAITAQGVWGALDACWRSRMRNQRAGYIVPIPRGASE